MSDLSGTLWQLGGGDATAGFKLAQQGANGQDSLVERARRRAKGVGYDGPNLRAYENAVKSLDVRRASVSENKE
jgi:hypothetical protein